MTTETCATCGSTNVRSGRRFCSRACYFASDTAKENGRRMGHGLKGKPTNNRGGNGGATKGRVATGRQIDGLRAGWERGTSSDEYQAVHSWVRRRFIQPDACEFCGDPDPAFPNWAAKDGVTYTRLRKDWLWLCRRCHHAHDDISRKGWETRRSQ